jgi:hypothetical protein
VASLVMLLLFRFLLLVALCSSCVGGEGCKLLVHAALSY